ncbi:MAG TPA: hypothetical protein VFG59_12745 [Anaeromyxobacter sp.]|nr:hypothetical protein [Anaeromyxobacter sp.]
MAEPFKLRHVEAIVGVFVLAALALTLAGVGIAARSRRWFEPSVEIAAAFPAEAGESLAPGTPVTVGQERVGEVLDVALREDGAQARLKVFASIRARLRADARAVLHLPVAGFLGQPGVELRVGLSAKPLPDHTPLPGAGGSEVTRDLDRLVQHVDELVQRLGPTVDRAGAVLAQLEEGGAGREAAGLLREARGLAHSAHKARILEEAAAAVADLQAVVASVRGGHGSAGKLLTDDALHARLVAAAERADVALAGVARLSASASSVTDDLQAITSRARAKADDLELLLARTETLVLRANQTLDTIQRHWLVGGATAPDDAPPLPPAVLDHGKEAP